MFLRWGFVVGPTYNPETGGQPLFGWPWLFISYILSFLPPSGTWWQSTPLTLLNYAWFCFEVPRPCPLVLPIKVIWKWWLKILASDRDRRIFSFWINGSLQRMGRKCVYISAAVFSPVLNAQGNPRWGQWYRGWVGSGINIWMCASSPHTSLWFITL
jgi:hypothetical protein